MADQLRLPSISFVVARSHGGNVIGRNDQLPWHLRTDLQRFKRITMGHPIIMGRTTFLSIGRLLPGRANIVLSRQPPNDTEGTIWGHGDTSLLWSNKLEDAMYLADLIALAKDQQEFFVIGGAQMYELFYKLVNKIHLTEVFTGEPPKDGDARFEFKIDHRKWTTLFEQDIPAGPHDQFPSVYSIIERKRKTVRYVRLKSYYTPDADADQWIADQYRKIGSAGPSEIHAPDDYYQLDMLYDGDER